MLERPNARFVRRRKILQLASSYLSPTLARERQIPPRHLRTDLFNFAFVTPAVQIPFEAVDVWVPLCNQDQEGSEVVLFHAGYFTNVNFVGRNSAASVPVVDFRCKEVQTLPPWRAFVIAYFLLVSEAGIRVGNPWRLMICLQGRPDSFFLLLLFGWPSA